MAEVENRRVGGKVVQKYIRYVGREVDGETLLSSLSDVTTDEVKLYGPVVVLDCLAKRIGLPELLGDRALEILAMVYVHCLDYKSAHRMEQWFKRTDLALILPLEGVTEARLLEALDSLENMDAMPLQQRIFERTTTAFPVPVSGSLYDVTNTYLYGKQCDLDTYRHDKEGVKGRPLIQVGLAVTKEFGIPHTIEGVKGTLTVCFNDRQQRDLRESRYDEIEQAQRHTARGRSVRRRQHRGSTPRRPQT